MFEREGQGWRLAYDPQREPFPLLIGGDGWASELTTTEGSALQSALNLIQRQHQDLVSSLMEEETICLEFTGDLPGSPQAATAGALWVALQGDRKTWTLRFVLQPAAGQRGLEGFWASDAAAAFAQACAELAWGSSLGLVPPDPLDPPD